MQRTVALSLTFGFWVYFKLRLGFHFDFQVKTCLGFWILKKISEEINRRKTTIFLFGFSLWYHAWWDVFAYSEFISWAATSSRCLFCCAVCLRRHFLAEAFYLCGRFIYWSGCRTEQLADGPSNRTTASTFEILKHSFCTLEINEIFILNSNLSLSIGLKPANRNVPPAPSAPAFRSPHVPLVWTKRHPSYLEKHISLCFCARGWIIQRAIGYLDWAPFFFPLSQSLKALALIQLRFYREVHLVALGARTTVLVHRDCFRQSAPCHNGTKFAFTCQLGFASHLALHNAA